MHDAEEKLKQKLKIEESFPTPEIEKKFTKEKLSKKRGDKQPKTNKKDSKTSKKPYKFIKCSSILIK